MYSVHIRPLVDMIFASEIAKKVAIGISGAVCTLSAYSKVRWQNGKQPLELLLSLWTFYIHFIIANKFIEMHFQ